ncbi:MAG: DegT/DnrJ/EryC1/StrS family aminotransferase [Eubacterium sp.]|jgi:perosamine synthetase|nr:DegT/DnrJ/EryC1/StrS family aminotransferase [Eubacterium sp.]
MKKIPVTIPYFDDQEAENVKKILDSGWVAQGPEVSKFEEVIAAHENVSYGVAVTSCTTALHLAMVSQGMSERMDVLAPAFTFVATTNAIVQTGAVPILVDICQETFNIDVKQIREVIQRDYQEKNGKLYNKDNENLLWGIVPVHEFGLCCDILEINQIAKEYNLTVIEDAACALGAKIGDAHQGGFGNTSCISFHPRKSITTGEGGMVLTDQAALAQKMKQLRTHGSTVSADARHAGKGFLLPEFPDAGYNYRMTDIQAAVGIAQADKLDYIIEEKRKRAEFYNGLIREKLPELVTPYVPDGYYHTYQSYVCMLDLKKLNLDSVAEGRKYRNILLQKLEDIGIATRQGTHAIHMLEYYKNRFGYVAQDFPNAYACDHLSITLPLYVQMSDSDQEYVIQAIREIIDKL